jgi:ubiquinone/menaquinone biosynthesis C-methylase UbiE
MNPWNAKQLVEQRRRELLSESKRSRRARVVGRAAQPTRSPVRRRSSKRLSSWCHLLPWRHGANASSGSVKSPSPKLESPAIGVVKQFDAMAVDYAVDNAVSPYNAYYERPAIISLLGNVAGLRVLEVGCGPGLLTAWLVERGAVVTASDVSQEMVDLARTVVGDRARMVIADLSQPLTFAADQSFDLVVASLVMHYIEDWHFVLGEFHRVLRPSGTVVFSTHHPTMDWELSPDDYFTTTLIAERWRKGSGDSDVTFWRRPLTAMTSAIASSGFLIERLVEPAANPELRDRDPAAYELIRTKPRFLFFRLRTDPLISSDLNITNPVSYP